MGPERRRGEHRDARARRLQPPPAADRTAVDVGALRRQDRRRTIPGPIEFYLLAVPLRVLGATAGLLLTAAAINAGFALDRVVGGLPPARPHRDVVGRRAAARGDLVGRHRGAHRHAQLEHDDVLGALHRGARVGARRRRPPAAAAGRVRRELRRATAPRGRADRAALLVAVAVVALASTSWSQVRRGDTAIRATALRWSAAARRGRGGVLGTRRLRPGHRPSRQRDRESCSSRATTPARRWASTSGIEQVVPRGRAADGAHPHRHTGSFFLSEPRTRSQVGARHPGRRRPRPCSCGRAANACPRARAPRVRRAGVARGGIRQRQQRARQHRVDAHQPLPMVVGRGVSHVDRARCRRGAASSAAWSARVRIAASGATVGPDCADRDRGADRDGDRVHEGTATTTTANARRFAIEKQFAADVLARIDRHHPVVIVSSGYAATISVAPVSRVPTGPSGRRRGSARLPSSHLRQVDAGYRAGPGTSALVVVSG